MPQVRYCLHAKIKCVQLCVCVGGGGEVINSEIVTTQLCLVAQMLNLSLGTAAQPGGPMLSPTDIHTKVVL